MHGAFSRNDDGGSMIAFLKRCIDRKRLRDGWIAAKNRKKIIDKLEQYYADIAVRSLTLSPRKLAIRDFERAKADGRLDKLNRIVKKVKR